MTTFDGFHFEHISSEFNGSWIQGSIIEDDYGNIWTSSYERLYKISHTSNETEGIRLIYNDDSLTTHYHVIDYDKDREGLWVTAERKIFFYSIKSGETTYYGETSGRSFCVVKDSTKTISHIIALPLIESKGFQVYSLYDKLEQIDPTIPENFTYSTSAHYDDKFIYIGTNNGVYIFDRNFMLIEHKFPQKKIFSIQKFKKYLIYLTSKGELIISRNSEIFRTSLENTTPSSPSNLKIIDEYVLFTIPTYGIYIYNINQFLQPNFRIINDEISSIITKDNYVGVTGSENIYLFASNNNSAEFITNSSEITHFLPIDENKLVLYNNKHIYLYRKDTKILKEIYNTEYENIYDVKSRKDNEILVTTSNEIFSINLESLLEKKKILTKTNFELNTTLYFDNGNIVSLLDNGTYLYKTDDSISHHEIGVHINSASISSDLSSAFLGTERGLYSITHDNKLKKLFDDSFLKNEIFVDITSFNNYLFAKTTTGLYLIDSSYNLLYKIDNSIVNHRNSSRFSNLALVEDQLYIGTKNGLYLYDSTFFPKTLPFSTINIVDVLLNGNSIYECREDSFEIPNDYESLFIYSQISDEIFSIENKINYTVSGPFYFKSTINQGDSIDLSFLSPGDYNLEVIGYNSNEVASPPVILSFSILPPYHQTWWFRTGVAFSLIGLGFGFNFLNTRRKLKIAERKLEKQKALSAQREKIADDLHDELGTELSKILYLSDEASEIKDEQKKGEIIEDITSLAAASIQNMRDMLWVLEDKHNSLESLIAKLRTSIQRTLKEYPIELEFQIEDYESSNFKDIIMSSEQRQQILLIIKESVHNIIKHSEANQVEVQIVYNAPELSIAVTDNGKGIKNTNEYMTSGRGLSSMKRRAEKIGADLSIEHVGNGTEVKIGLKLPGV